MEPLYPCDPLKNVNCKKEMCFMWGGECSQTTDPKYARTVPQGEKRLSFRSWEELLKAAHYYVVMGYEVEVKGWDDMSNNVLTIRDRWESEDREEAKAMYEEGFKDGQKLDAKIINIERKYGMDLAWECAGKVMAYSVDDPHVLKTLFGTDATYVILRDNSAPEAIAKIKKSMSMEYSNYCPNCGAKMVEPQESEDKDGSRTKGKTE